MCLECSPEAVLTRIGANVGGDRGERTDDDASAVRRKLEVYRERTAPLVEHYRERGAAIHMVNVAAEMTPVQVYEAVCAAQTDLVYFRPRA